MARSSELSGFEFSAFLRKRFDRKLNDMKKRISETFFAPEYFDDITILPFFLFFFLA